MGAGATETNEAAAAVVEFGAAVAFSAGACGETGAVFGVVGKEEKAGLRRQAAAAGPIAQAQADAVGPRSVCDAGDTSHTQHLVIA